MSRERRTRVLVVTDDADPSPALLRAVADRAGADSVIADRATAELVQFRLVVLNPARAELHVLHPERHDRAFEAECRLLATLPLVEEAAGSDVIGSVSVRHDPAEAIEEVVLSEPVDEILLALSGVADRSWAHRVVARRLRRFGTRVTVVS